MVDQLSAAQWIKALNLQPHPEGGFYRETYRSPDVVSAQGLPDRFTGERSLATAIYYLLRLGDVSRLHKLRADEIWCFHAGNSLNIHKFYPEGSYRNTRLGLNPTAGAVPQDVVPAGCWFGAEVAGTDTLAFTLISCCLAPGFEFADFELGDREKLLAAWPEHTALIQKLV